MVQQFLQISLLGSAMGDNIELWPIILDHYLCKKLEITCALLVKLAKSCRHFPSSELWARHNTTNHI